MQADRNGTERHRPAEAGRNPVLAAAVMLVVIGVGALVVNRWIAGTRDAALILTAAWFAGAGIGSLLWARGDANLTRTLATALGLAAIGGGAILYWTGFRDTEVDEQVVSATATLSGAERDAALAAGGSDAGSEPVREKGSGGSQQTREKPKPERGPVSLAKDPIAGADGHDARGTAELIKDGKERKLVLTDFEVDPGPGIKVYLTPSTDSIDDRIELGDLKGTKGDQQYAIPAGADLGRYDSLVIYCAPFTVRMAIADLS